MNDGTNIDSDDSLLMHTSSLTGLDGLPSSEESAPPPAQDVVSWPDFSPASCVIDPPVLNGPRCEPSVKRCSPVSTFVLWLADGLLRDPGRLITACTKCPFRPGLDALAPCCSWCMMYVCNCFSGAGRLIQTCMPC